MAEKFSISVRKLIKPLIPLVPCILDDGTDLSIRKVTGMVLDAAVEILIDK